MENRLIATGAHSGNTSCFPKSRGVGSPFVSGFVRTRKKIEAEIKVTKQLLQLVNTEEEYDLLTHDLAEHERFLPLASTSSSMKGGAALICR